MVPLLVDFDWRVDIKTASNLATTDSSSKSGQQTCILQLKVYFLVLMYCLNFPLPLSGSAAYFFYFITKMKKAKLIQPILI